MKRCLLILFALLLCVPLCMAEGPMIAREDIGIEDITEFYYTYDSSADPPEYQRYRFHAEGGRYFFFHEKREGDDWPLTEDDASVSGTLELSENEWILFWQLLSGGKVRNRKESLDDGDAGPWLYLYWKGDQGICQEFSFPSWAALTAFESFCEELKEREVALREEREAFVRSVPTLVIEANGNILYADLEDHSSAKALVEKLNSGGIEVDMHDYGGFEKVGSLPWSLPRNDETITTVPGDVILYQGNQITIYYDQNTWEFTRLARIDCQTRESLLEILGDRNVTVRFWLEWSE